MSFSNILFLRPELLKGDGIQGIIDIENINNKKRKRFESSPGEFFSLTFLTSYIQNVLHNLNILYSIHYRIKFVEPGIQIPVLPELQVISSMNLAMIRGRIKNRPKGTASNKVFRHGGLSLMKVITPYLVLERN